MQENYIYIIKFHIDINLMHVYIIISYVDINRSYVVIIMLHLASMMLDTGFSKWISSYKKADSLKKLTCMST